MSISLDQTEYSFNLGDTDLGVKLPFEAPGTLRLLGDSQHLDGGVGALVGSKPNPWVRPSAEGEGGGGLVGGLEVSSLGGLTECFHF